MLRLVCCIGIVAGCSEAIEYGVHKPRDYPGEGEDLEVDTGPLPPAEDSGEPEPTDTGEPIDEEPPDPSVDTGEPDLETCLDINTPDTVEVNDECVAVPVVGPLEAVVEWTMPDFPEGWEYNQILAAPAVGQLTDDNEDGFIDARDVPDIMVVMDDGGEEGNTHGVLRRVDGDGSSSESIVQAFELESDQYFPFRYSGVALGDVDGDAITDVVIVLERVAGPSCEEDCPDVDPEDHPVGPPPPPMDPPTDIPAVGCYIGAFEVDGTLKWVATDSWLECGGHTPAVADLEGDGDVEVVVGRLIVNGVDGTTQGEGSLAEGRHFAYDEIGMISSIADLDGDGIQEIIAGGTLYAPDGSTICSLPDPTRDGYTAPADFDMDGVGEFVIIGDNYATVAEADCNETASWLLPGIGTGGPPTVADFDADGMPEIGVATASSYAVYEPDGTLIWEHPVSDASSHATGSTVFDFEGDGRPEVVYADETTLWVFDGPTGEVRLEDHEHNSRTLHEYPIVVDVDGDGYPEIVVPNGGGHDGVETDGIYVLGSADESWLGGRQVWNQHAYNIVNVLDDLSIPPVPTPNWPLHNNFRSGDVNPVAGENSPDAIPLAEVCTLECSEGLLELELRLANQGTSTLRTDMQITVYAVRDTGWDPVEIIGISPPIEPGGTSEPLSLHFSSEDIGPAGLVVVVDDAEGIETVRECDEDNNAIALPEATCL